MIELSGAFEYMSRAQLMSKIGAYTMNCDVNCQSAFKMTSLNSHQRLNVHHFNT